MHISDKDMANNLYNLSRPDKLILSDQEGINKCKKEKTR